MFKLVIQDDEGKTTVVPLIRDEITIGRKEGNTIRLTERNVSRRHARILRNNGEVQIEDLGSYNGIRVNNARIAERVSLRISDQVQIGDYKLYLKAEGVEQVDDARTMPIERIETATEVMGAVTPPSTQPIPATPAPSVGPSAARAAVGTADTDPAGRPIASAAQVAALTAPVGYGKLVVFSSNFAGKEFDLSRPQMIIGRTDENDICINHRSISRNHAKITRDPETNRYTISDLQSSNGVRVNGQDYGKVELRRGDTIDLGHVRLRFVEPGEDFVFERDVVVTDVPEGGSKKGLAIAVALAIMVLASLVAFFMLKSKGGNDVVTPNPGSGSEHGSTPSIADGGNDNIVVAPMQDIDAGSAGATTNNNPGNDQLNQLDSECNGYFNDKKWQDALNCANKMSALDAARGKKYVKQAQDEQKADIQLGKLEDAARDKELRKAKSAYDSIPENSVYKSTAKAKYEALESEIAQPYVSNARDANARHDCKSARAALAQATQQGGNVADQVRPFVLSCKEITPPADDCRQSLVNNTKKCKDQFCASNPGDGACKPAQGSAVTPPPAACDADALADEGRQDAAIGQHGAALGKFESAYKCRPDTQLLKLTFMAACNAVNKPKAKTYYKKLDAANAAHLAQICIKAGITKAELDN